MSKLMLFMLLPLALLPSYVYGYANLQNTNIIAESNEFSNYLLVLEFSDYLYANNGNPLPVLESAYLDIDGSVVDLEDLRVRTLGNSFSVHSDDILIYAHGTGDGQYKMNLYLLDGGNFNRIHLETIKDLANSSAFAANDLRPAELVVLVQQDIRTHWGDTYDISVRVFDKEVNRTPQFYQSFGAIKNANVEVKLVDEEGTEIAKLKGVTDNKGFWNEKFLITPNLINGGKYLVDISVSYLGTTYTQILETFVIPSVPDTDSS